MLRDFWHVGQSRLMQGNVCVPLRAVTGWIATLPSVASQCGHLLMDSSWLVGLLRAAKAYHREESFFIAKAG